MHAVAAFFASIITFASGFFAPTVASNSPVDIRTTQPAAVAGAQTDITGDPFNDAAAASAVAAALAAAAAPPSQPPPTQTVINQPVIERIIERIVPQGGTISAATLAAILADFERSISDRIAAIDPPKADIPKQVASAGSSAGYYFVPASQRIDQLANTTINSPTISGGTISNAVVSGTLSGTFSGASSFTAATTSSLVISSIPWSLLSTDGSGNVVATSTPTATNYVATSATASQFPYASSTALSVSGIGYFGMATSTTINANMANVSVFNAGTLALSNLGTLANGFISYASSTITAGLFSMNGGASTTNLTASGSAWLTNATSTSLFSTTASSTNLFAQTASLGILNIPGITNAILSTNASGQVVATTSIGMNYISGILPVANGGTATGTQVTNGVTYFDGTRITSGTGFVFNGTNVGIGTTSPGALLSANGNILGAGTLALTGTSGTTTIASGQGFTIGGSQFVLQQGSGNVGIGTTNPAVPLHVNGKFFSTGGVWVNPGDISSTVNNASYYGLGMSNLNLYPSVPLSTAVQLAGFYGLNFQTGGGSMVIDGSGRVGIGTTSPKAQLEISGTGQTTAALSNSGNVGGMLLLRDSGASAGNGGAILFGNVHSGVSGSLGFAAIKGLLTNGTSNTVGDLAFSTRNAVGDTALTERMRIDSSGHIGMGATPLSTIQLYVVADSNTDYAVYGVAGKTTGYGIVGVSQNGANYSLLGYTNNWGILCQGVQCGGNVAWTNTSDARLKTAIKDIDASSTLASLMRLRPVTYHWKDAAIDAGRGEQLGFIAQEVEPLFPALVTKGASTTITLADGSKETIPDPKALDYSGFVVPLVKAVQEIASIGSAFKASLITWLGDAGNGIGDLFAQRLCLTDASGNRTCIDQQQLAVLLAASQSSNSPTTPAGKIDMQAPVIELNGNASSTIQVGDTYSDLGARIVAPESDLNLGIVIVLDSATTTDVSIDTSAPGEHTILYTVTSPTTGLTSSIMRTIIITPAELPPTPTEETNPFNGPPANDNASSTAALDAAA